MKLRHTLIVAAAACGLAAAGAAFAQPMGGGHMEGGWHHGDGMELLHSLTLTEIQKKQAHQIGKTAWTQSKPVMEQLHTLHEQMETQLLTAGSITADQLSPTVVKEEALRSQLDQIHLNTVLQIRALLTPEQLSQAASTHQKLEALHEQERAVMDAGSHGAE